MHRVATKLLVEPVTHSREDIYRCMLLGTADNTAVRCPLTLVGFLLIYLADSSYLVD